VSERMRDVLMAVPSRCKHSWRGYLENIPSR
jgi:hypothetical protein